MHFALDVVKCLPYKLCTMEFVKFMKSIISERSFVVFVWDIPALAFLLSNKLVRNIKYEPPTELGNIYIYLSRPVSDIDFVFYTTAELWPRYLITRRNLKWRWCKPVYCIVTRICNVSLLFVRAIIWDCGMKLLKETNNNG